MPSVREQVQAVFDNVAHSLHGIERPVLLRVAPILQRAHGEIVQELFAWRAKHSGRDTFTEQRYRNVLVNLDVALGELKRSGVEMEHALKDENGRIGPRSLTSLQREWSAFSHIFEGTAQPLPLDEAVVLARGKKLLWPQFKTSAAKYADTIGERTQFHLAVSRARGETIDELTNRLEKHLPDVFRSNRWDAERLARTECLTADTLVDAAVVGAVYRRWYDGPIVEIVTSRGRKLTATPNHPMLTRRGWVCSDRIHNGDDLVCDVGDQDHRSSGNEHVTRSPAKIGEIFDALSTVGIRERIATAKPDFHGDGIDGQVDILRPDRLLYFGDFAPLYEPLLKKILSPSDFAATGFCDRCGRLLSYQRQPCLCSMSESHALPIKPLGNRCGFKVEHSPEFNGVLPGFVKSPEFGIVDVISPFPRFSTSGVKRDTSFRETPGNASVSDCQIYPPGTDTHPPSNACLAESRGIEFDSVVSVTIRQFSGHVFNLSTPYGYFTINGAYTGNTMNAYNVNHEEAIKQAAEEDQHLVSRWDASYDFRRCPMCASLDGQTVDVTKGEKFVARWRSVSKRGGIKLHVRVIDGVLAHPCCRCTQTAWRESWAVYSRNKREISEGQLAA